MSEKPIKRLKAVLSEQHGTNTWLIDKLDKNRTFFSRWSFFKPQHLIETFVTIAILMHIDTKKLIETTKI